MTNARNPLARAMSHRLAWPLVTLLLLLGVIVAMVALLVAWAYAGAGPGTFVAIFGLAFMLFVGPAMAETFLDRQGVRTPAVVAGFGEMSPRYDRARTCKLVWEDRDTGEIGRVETGGLSACTDDIKAGDPAVVVVDPAAIVAAEPRGLHRLYVVLTRAVSTLVVLHRADLPAPLTL